MSVKKREIMWICGGIDYNGVVIAHESYVGDDSSLSHTIEEKAGTSWRWDINKQCFMNNFIPQKRNFTTDELFAVQDYLIKNGYAALETFMKKRGRDE